MQKISILLPKLVSTSSIEIGQSHYKLHSVEEAVLLPCPILDINT